MNTIDKLRFNIKQREKIFKIITPLMSEYIIGKTYIILFAVVSTVTFELIKKYHSYHNTNGFKTLIILFVCVSFGLFGGILKAIISYLKMKKNPPYVRYCITDRRIIIAEDCIITEIPYEKIMDIYINKKFKRRRIPYLDICFEFDEKDLRFNDNIRYNLFGIRNQDNIFYQIEKLVFSYQSKTQTGLFNSNYIGEYGNSRLLNYVSIGEYDMAKLLIDLGADVNLTNDFGITPLIAATKKNDSKMIRLLIKNGAKN